MISLFLIHELSGNIGGTLILRLYLTLLRRQASAISWILWLHFSTVEVNEDALPIFFLRSMLFGGLCTHTGNAHV